MEGHFKPASEVSPEERKREWLRYYSKKRIYEQLLQVQMLKDLPIQTVLEIGPYYGLVTAMLGNAGFDVTTMDIVPRTFKVPECPHIEMDLTDLRVDGLRGFDCIMCCATLEHIRFEQAQRALETFHQAGAPYVLISLPYQGAQLFLQLYCNRHTFIEHFSFKKFRFLRTFKADEEGDPHGHKWEIGYRGFPLKRIETMVRDIGFEILRRDFSHPSYCVFFTLRNRSAPD